MKQTLLIIILFHYLCNSFCQISGNSDKNFNLKDCKNIFKTDTIFKNPQISASYPGGEKEWQKYLNKNLDMSIGSDNNAPEGIHEVTVRFIVNKDGDICSVRAETKFGYGIEEEIIRVIKKSKNWNPALINGIPVISYKRLTVNYDLVYL
jgi:protein TonB